MKSVRIYGRAVGHASHARVTAGFVQALRSRAVLGGIVELDAELSDDEPEPLGALADVGILTGPLNHAARMTKNARHPARWAMVAPNSNKMPAVLMQLLNGACTRLLAPSGWAARVLSEYTSLPITVVPHGVDAAFLPTNGTPLAASFLAQLTAQYSRSQFLVRHFSSSARQRKGTLELVEVWENLIRDGKLPEMALLELVLDPEAHAGFIEWMGERGEPPTNVIARGRLSMSASSIQSALATCHLVAQPSRGEAFGMVPVEALSVGTPVVATLCTGHSEWFDVRLEGVRGVSCGAMGPIDDLPGAEAPVISRASLAEALVESYENWTSFSARARAQAPRFAEQWQWENQLAPLFKLLDS